MNRFYRVIISISTKSFEKDIHLEDLWNIITWYKSVIKYDILDMNSFVPPVMCNTRICIERLN